MNTLTDEVKHVMKRKRWVTASQVAASVYGDENQGPTAARRIRALRAAGENIQTRQKGDVFQYRRV